MNRYAKLSRSQQSKQMLAKWRHVQFDVSGTRLLRQNLLELGQTMMAADMLKQATDILFLSPEEVRDARIQLAERQQLLTMLPQQSIYSLQSYL